MQADGKTPVALPLMGNYDAYDSTYGSLDTYEDALADVTSVLAHGHVHGTGLSHPSVELSLPTPEFYIRVVDVPEGEL